MADLENAVMILARRIDALEKEVEGRNRPISFEVKVDKETIKFYITGTNPVQDKQIIDNTYMAFNYAHQAHIMKQTDSNFGKEGK